MRRARDAATQYLYVGELTQFNIQAKTDLEDAVKDICATSFGVLYVTWSWLIHEQYLL